MYHSSGAFELTFSILYWNCPWKNNSVDEKYKTVDLQFDIYLVIKILTVQLTRTYIFVSVSLSHYLQK